MKKILYSVLTLSAVFFATSCDQENRGTTTEIVSANDDENVNPEHIRGYGNQPSNAAGNFAGSANETYRQRAENISSRMASDLGLDKETQSRVTTIYLDREQQLELLGNSYNYNQTNRMGGETDNDAQNDMGTNNNVSPEPSTSNGTAASDNMNGSMNNSAPSNNSDAGQMTDAQKDAKRKEIMENSEQKLKAALTPAQWEKYQKNRDKYNNRQ